MTPDLTTYDVLLVNSSAGKDSQAMLDLVVELATAAGVRDRVVVVHCDLGRVEWQGTRDLAEVQARHYGVRFEVVRRPQGDLLDHVQKHKRWPSPTQRYCTSDHKRGQVATLLTLLAREARERGVPRVRILQCLGMRADESPGRAKMAPFEGDARATNTRRHVDRWLPLHAWTAEMVWARIRQSGVPHHYAYDLGMPRLSCVLCIYAPDRALVLAGSHNRELLSEYVRVERQIGHRFKAKVSIADIEARVEAGEVVPAGELQSWCM